MFLTTTVWVTGWCSEGPSLEYFMWSTDVRRDGLHANRWWLAAVRVTRLLIYLHRRPQTGRSQDSATATMFFEKLGYPCTQKQERANTHAHSHTNHLHHHYLSSGLRLDRRRYSKGSIADFVLENFAPFFFEAPRTTNIGSAYAVVITIPGTFLNCSDSLLLNLGPRQENYMWGVCRGDSRLRPDLGGLSSTLVCMSPRQYWCDGLFVCCVWCVKTGRDTYFSTWNAFPGPARCCI